MPQNAQKPSPTYLFSSSSWVGCGTAASGTASLTHQKLGGMVKGSHPRSDDLGGARMRQGKWSLMGASEGMERGQAYREQKSRCRGWLSVLAILVVWVASVGGQDTGNPTTGSGGVAQAEQKTEQANTPQQATKASPDTKKGNFSTRKQQQNEKKNQSVR